MTRYAVDLDGTLADTVSATLEIYNERYGTHYAKADVNRWTLWNVFPELQHLPEAKRRDIILRIMDQAWIEGRVRPEPGAAEFMIELMQREPEVDILTGRGSGTSDEVLMNWLAHHDIPYRNLVRARGGGKTKVFFGYDVYTDDDPTLAADIADRWPNKRVYLVDQPWNRSVPNSPRVTRVHDLQEALPGGKQMRLSGFRRHDVRVRQHRRRA